MIPQKDTLHILLADDDVSIREYITDVLEPYNFEVFDTKDGLHALNVIKKLINTPKRIDLLITDIHMPYLSGIELIRELNYNRIFIPTIIMSGSIGDYDIYQLDDSEWVSFLDKPFVPKDLLHKITISQKNYC